MNARKQTLLTLLGALTLISGCSGSSSATNIQQSSEPEVIHGYTLPPEPNQTINNSTLLGIDSNDNGVRDDVEIWILKKYKNSHPIYTEIAMQATRARKKVLENPDQAKSIYAEVSAAGDCASFYRVCSDNITSVHIAERIVDKNLREIIFNTKIRVNAYATYESILSGGSYTIPWCSERKQLCDFNTTKFELLP